MRALNLGVLVVDSGLPIRLFSFHLMSRFFIRVKWFAWVVLLVLSYVKSLITVLSLGKGISEVASQI